MGCTSARRKLTQAPSLVSIKVETQGTMLDNSPRIKARSCNRVSRVFSEWTHGRESLARRSPPPASEMWIALCIGGFVAVRYVLDRSSDIVEIKIHRSRRVLYPSEIFQGMVCAAPGGKLDITIHLSNVTYRLWRLLAE